MRISDWSSDVCSSDLRAIAIFTLFDPADRRIDLGDQFALTVAGAHFDRPVGLARRAVGEVGFAQRAVLTMRSAERRVGKECVSTCRSRWSPSYLKKNYTLANQIPSTTQHHLLF